MSGYAQLNPTLVPTRLRRSLVPTRLPGNLPQTWHNAAEGGRATLAITIPSSTTTIHAKESRT
uniref:Uncharacterized protein n=1 Tax=Candidatus Kentrum sp. SD TaxID=2126332 RepID=A0A450Y7L0_9GAMM|nr:MAG: hypothetical protein BECKSD772F_GA0070984_101610 [Candidatus Kentron sp. SD]VFK48557.1 MAG: hypothetical protein BECKSD772E_GA0070983_113011 [Candidatus Kentron sp. SD]